MQGGVDRGVVKVDRLRDEHEQQPDNEHEHVEEEQPASKVEQTSNTRPKRTYTHKQTHTHTHTYTYTHIHKFCRTRLSFLVIYLVWPPGRTTPNEAYSLADLGPDSQKNLRKNPKFIISFS